MKFSEIVEQAIALLQDSGRVSFRALKMEFDLDDDQLDVLKEELIEARRLARDENGKALIWVGNQEATHPPAEPALKPQSPATYTPPRLAERRFLA